MVIHIIICDGRPSPPGGVKLRSCAAGRLTRWTTPWRGGTSWERVNCISRNTSLHASPLTPSQKPNLPCLVGPIVYRRDPAVARVGVCVSSWALPQLTLCRRRRQGPAPSVAAVVWCAAPGIKTPPRPPGRWWEWLTDVDIIKIILSVYPWQPASATCISCATPVPLPSVNQKTVPGTQA